MKIQSLCLTAGLCLSARGTSSRAGQRRGLLPGARRQVPGVRRSAWAAAGHGSQNQNATARIAIDKCNAGDPAGIPVLEQELKNARITLPQRS